MGTNNFTAPFNNKKDTYAHVSGVKLATVSAKPALVKITTEEIRSKRNPAYKYLLP
jgi:hypothetical protein